MYYLMYKWEILLAITTLVVFFILMIRRYASNSTKIAVDKISESAFCVKDNYPEPNKLKAENISFEQAGVSQQLQLAILLVEKALPVWKKYTCSPEFLRYAKFADAQNKIESNLLQKSIEEIKLASSNKFAWHENKNIKQLYNDFVNPVIALQDGVWTTTYPVKKIFLSIYYLLKSIIENNSANDKEIFLSTAIGYATDCLDLSKLYTSDEITSFLEMYKISQ